MARHSKTTTPPQDHSFPDTAKGAQGAFRLPAAPARGQPKTTPSAPLGIYAKTEAAGGRSRITWAQVGDEDTGEVSPWHQVGTRLEEVVMPQEARARRYALKSVVNRIMPKSRTAKCCRWRVPNKAIQVLRGDESRRAFYSGLQVCASVWGCPVCSAKISERRRVELQGAIATAKAKGWAVYLLTLTIPHGLGDDLGDMLAGMMAAWRRTTTGRAGKAFRKAMGIRGTVRALEVTYGANGWHPHFHALLFLDGEAATCQVQERFLPLWQDACIKSGLPKPSDERGVRVDDGSYAAKYAAKWGLESELTKGHVKTGKRGSMTPWDILRELLQIGSEGAGVGRPAPVAAKLDGAAGDTGTPAKRARQLRALFLVYAEAFHSKRQLYWSNGLKELLAVEDLKDEELAAREDEAASVLAELTDDQWRAILATRSEAVILDVAENHPDALAAVMEALVAMAGRKERPPGSAPGGGPEPARIASCRPEEHLDG